MAISDITLKRVTALDVFDTLHPVSNYNTLINKPATFAPAPHTHPTYLESADITEVLIEGALTNVSFGDGFINLGTAPLDNDAGILKFDGDIVAIGTKDNYQGWDAYLNGALLEQIASQEALGFDEGAGIDITYDSVRDYNIAMKNPLSDGTVIGGVKVRVSGTTAYFTSNGVNA